MTAVHASGANPAVVRPNPVSTATLTLVELRKMGNTRSGAVLLALVFATAVAMTVARLFVGDAGDRTLVGFLTNTTAPVSVLLPLVGMLAVTSEWSQRTALITFTLVPRRSRVFLAKLAAVMTLAVATVVVTLVLGVIGNGLAPMVTEADGSWELTGAALGNLTLFHVTSLFVGFAIGMLTMNSVLGIVVHFGVPTIWSILRDLVSGVDEVAAWLDTSATFGPLGGAAALSGEEWLKVGVGVGVWGVLLSLLGCLRLRRTEIK